LGTAFFFGGESTSYVNDLLLLSGAAPAGAIPQIATDGIVDVFSGGGGPFAPGEIVSIYGSSLGPVAAVTSTFDVSTGQLPVWSANVSVSINGGAAPLYYVSSGQVNVQIPYELEGAHQASVAVTYNGTVSETRTIQIAPTAPRLWPGILNQDGSLNSAGNPAAVGDIIVLFATGQGLTNPPSVTGRVAIAPYASPQDPVRVSVGGQDGAVLFAGVAPGASGVMQVNVRVPAGIHASAGVVLAVGDSHSQNGVTLAVR
jgi:uncharacterized protein (TIGR03437 family)